MNNNKPIDLKENVNHGDFMLPFTIYSGHLRNVYEDISIHWHEEMEILYVNEGTGNYMIDLCQYKLEQGDIIFIHPHTLHSGTHIKDSDMIWSSMVFNIDMLKTSSTDSTLMKYIAPIYNKEHSLPTIIKSTEIGHKDILDIFNRCIISYKNKNLGYELEIKGLLFILLSSLYQQKLIKRDNTTNQLSLLNVNKIKIVLNYMHNNYNSEITISYLANLCEFSEYYFMRFFKKHVGMSCIQYLNGYRLERAGFLLNNTDMSIMDISLEVGFDSLSYFIKLFKRKYNFTPLEYKKSKNNFVATATEKK